MRQRVSLVLGSVAIALVTLEAALRIFPLDELQMNDPAKYTKLEGIAFFGEPHGTYREIYPLRLDARSYYKSSNGVIEYSTDQLGARWLDSGKRKLNPNLAVLIGDSYTYGFGLRYADSFGHRLELKFPQWSFVNFAGPGTDARRALAVYKSKGAALPHKMLIYGLHLNDLIEFPTSYVIAGQGLDLFLSRHSMLGNILMRRWDNHFGRRKRIQEINSAEAQARPFFTENFKAILGMRELAKARGIPFYVVILPVLVDLDQGPFAETFSRISGLLKDSGIQTADLTESLAGYRDQELWITPYDQHPNELANSVFAEKLSEFLGPRIGN